MAPAWLNDAAIWFLWLSAISALAIAADILNGRRQQMAIMNFVWPITALWSGPCGLIVYWHIGRPPKRRSKPFWESVLVGDTHCAAGCAIGDVIGEWIVFLTGFTVAGTRLYADYFLDFAFAFTFGIIFQYFSIAPMRNIHGWAGIKAALHADTISLIAFEVGMFAWMAFSSRVLFHPALQPTAPAYWLSMQIAMFIGFLTAWPANWWLIRHHLKEAM